MKFPKSVGKLPKSSCLIVIFRDTTYADASAIYLAEKKIDMSNVSIDLTYPYEIKSSKPKPSWREYSVTAILNRGWCPDNRTQEWLRTGDFFMDTRHRVGVNPYSNKYEVDLEMVIDGK